MTRTTLALAALLAAGSFAALPASAESMRCGFKAAQIASVATEEKAPVSTAETAAPVEQAKSEAAPQGETRTN
jgi:hypothetical protein